MENTESKTFADLELDGVILEGISVMGYTTPTPVQEAAIPQILHGVDVIACAQTGTGKTAAYLLPLMQNILIEQKNNHKVNTLILVPTRELALQIDQNLQGMAYYAPLSSLAIYGGGDGAGFETQKRALVDGADIIIATPGRLLSHLSLGYVDLGHIRHLVLDESDRMLDMGFIDDIMTIIKQMPANRQTLMFSATMPSEIRVLARKILKEPVEINLAVSKPAAGVLQGIYAVFEDKKTDLLVSLLEGKSLQSILVFASTKRKVDQIEKKLLKAKLEIACIHSDYEQSEREEAMLKFKNKSVSILVATDIVSRGIDIESIDLVVNYDVPMDAEDYVHRVGRTARAQNTGVAITFVTPEDAYRLVKIEDLIESKIRVIPLPPHLGASPDLTEKPKRKPGGFRRKGSSGFNKSRNS